MAQLQLSADISEPASKMIGHLDTYRDGFAKVSAAALAGEITTPQDGNKAMKAYKTSINAIEEGVVGLEKLLGERQAERLAQHRADDRRLSWAIAVAALLFASLVTAFARLVGRSVTVPMAAAQSYDVFNDEAGFANRGTFVVDRSGVIRFAEMKQPGEPRDQSLWTDALKALQAG